MGNEGHKKELLDLGIKPSPGPTPMHTYSGQAKGGKSPSREGQAKGGKSPSREGQAKGGILTKSPSREGQAKGSPESQAKTTTSAAVAMGHHHTAGKQVDFEAESFGHSNKAVRSTTRGGHTTKATI